MAKRRGRKQRARRTLRRMGVAALVLFTVLLWPMGGMVDEAVPGEARSQVLAPEFTPEAATATAPVLTPSPEPTATPSPTATPVPEPQEITITFGGDCTLAGDVNKNNTRFQSFVEEYGYDYFLANLKPIFEADDLTIVNLEGPLTTSDDKRGAVSSISGVIRATRRSFPPPAWKPCTWPTTTRAISRKRAMRIPSPRWRPWASCPMAMRRRR